MSRLDPKAHGSTSIEARGAHTRTKPRNEMPTHKISLDQQIEEVVYELRQRDTVYPKLLSRNPGRRSELAYHVERLMAVRATLTWLRENEDEIRAAIGSAPEIAGRDDVRSILTAAVHALRSYQHHNASPVLAKELADKIEQLLAALPVGKEPVS